jgi:FKBP-type peptidyl-prolyl cis-trans isomerase FklB
MNYNYLSPLGLLLLVGVAVAQDPHTAGNGPFKSERDKASYAYGMNIARSWKEGQMDLDVETVTRGLKDALAGGSTLLTQTEMNDTLARFGREIRVAQQHHREQVAEENRRQGEAFLAQNKTRPGVITLPTGLQYQVLAEGTGQSPDLTNWVKLKYRGSHLNGAEVDSSEAHPQSNLFSLRGVIHGWTEALQMMKPGAKWRLFVPPSLAFGLSGSPEVGPNETLIYDLELVSVLSSRPLPTAEDIKNERDPDGD